MVVEWGINANVAVSALNGPTQLILTRSAWSQSWVGGISLVSLTCTTTTRYHWYYQWTLLYTHFHYMVCCITSRQKVALPQVSRCVPLGGHTFSLVQLRSTLGITLGAPSLTKKPPVVPLLCSVPDVSNTKYGHWLRLLRCAQVTYDCHIKTFIIIQISMYDTVSLQDSLKFDWNSRSF